MGVYWQVTVAGAVVMALGVTAIRYSGLMGQAFVSAWRRQGFDADQDLARSSAMIVGYGACLLGAVAILLSIVAPRVVPMG